jgi:predicted flap endonuclease-1-like 5' DNA nuclease/uncharacterized coiled-coil DUF342 family protein
MFQNMNPLDKSTAVLEILIMLLGAFLLGVILSWLLKKRTRVIEVDTTVADQLKLNLQKTTDEFNVLRNQFNQNSNELGDARLKLKDLDDLHAQLKKSKDNNLDLIAQLNQLKLERNNLAAVSTTDYDDLKARLDNLNKTNLELVSQKNRLQAELDALKSSQTAGNDLAKSLQIKLDAADKNNSDYRAEVNKLKAEANAWFETRDKQTAELSQLRAKLATADADFKNLQNEIAILKAKLEDAANAKAKLDLDLKNTLGDLKALQFKYDDAIHDKHSAGIKIRSLKGQMSDLDEQLDTLIALKNQLTTENSQLNVALKACEDSKTAQPAVAQPLGLNADKVAKINFTKIGTASADERDDLQIIKGIGPFIERKLHAIGIYTFRQIANFDDEDKELVNDAIEFFPGRIDRENWVGQARELMNK